MVDPDLEAKAGQSRLPRYHMYAVDSRHGVSGTPLDAGALKQPLV